MKVRKLRWQKRRGELFATASKLMRVTYFIEEINDFYSVVVVWLAQDASHAFREKCKTLDEAKATAQAHYEKLILEGIE